MAQPKLIADFEVQLSAGISAGATSLVLSSATDDDGVALPAGTYYFTIDNGNSAKEYVTGSLSGTTLSSVATVSRQGVETSGVVRAHRAGASIIMTDFATYKQYTDNASVNGALDASTTVKGIVEEATVAEINAGTAAGGTGARLFINPSTVITSETVAGLVEEATDAEVTAGTATGGTGAKLIVTPAKLKTVTDALPTVYQPIIVATCGTTTRDFTNTGTQNIAHGLGRAPKKVSIVMGLLTGTAGAAKRSVGAWTAASQCCIYEALDSDGGVNNSYAVVYAFSVAQNRYAYGSISVDATNITITWTENYSSITGTANIMWQAEA